ncbi:MAG: 2-phosphosulfolactate phosphatase [Bacteroidetes bacterium]|nr:2-phosphosulfolactate phosphatase [Bacteroidota bacterium]MBS1628464.1 2-phosphosulfolactate phosphatase [Bacteroidota bacterium]
MIPLPKLEVCLSPALLHLFDAQGTITVIIDVFRATSTIVAALDNGASEVIPVAAVDECIAVGNRTPNSITAGERDGNIAHGLQMGNSPLSFPRSFVEGKSVVLTTTNGTRLLHMVQGSAEIITGSFLNLSALCSYLVSQNKPVLLGCAAWKDRFNLEDTLLAGAIVNRVASHFSIQCDSALAAATIEQQCKSDYLNYLRDSSHYRRLTSYGLLTDLEYCTTPDLHPIVPILRQGSLKNAKEV